VTYIIFNFASKMTDSELWYRHAWLFIERITGMVVVTLLQE